MKKYAILHTLGCRLNSADSALLVDRLEKAGYSVVQSADSVDLVVVNSCTVTAEAARKSRQAVRKFRASYPGALIVVTGCSAELDRDAYLKDGAGKRGIVESGKTRHQRTDPRLSGRPGMSSAAKPPA